MTARGELFAVRGLIGGRWHQSTASTVAAAVCVADYLHREVGALRVHWQLREDLAAPPVLMFLRDELSGLVHATVLVAGKAAQDHPQALCGHPLCWDRTRVCDAGDAEPCPQCLHQANRLGGWAPC